MGARLAGIASALGLHLILLAALLAYEPARSVLLAAAPIMVELIAPSRPEPIKPVPPAQLPKPLPVVKRAPLPPEPMPVLTAPAVTPTETPSPATASPPPPVVALPDAAPPAAAPVAVPVATTAVPVTPPVFDANYLRNPTPAFPAQSRRMGEQGRVVLRVLVAPAGDAAEVQVRTSSGFERLDHAARDAVRRWKFVPARRGAEPVPAWVLIPISFRLKG